MVCLQNLLLLFLLLLDPIPALSSNPNVKSPIWIWPGKGRDGWRKIKKTTGSRMERIVDLPLPLPLPLPLNTLRASMTSIIK